MSPYFNFMSRDFNLKSSYFNLNSFYFNLRVKRCSVRPHHTTQWLLQYARVVATTSRG